MNARIPLPAGGYALAHYVWEWQQWEISDGLKPVSCRRGASVTYIVRALLRVYPEAETYIANLAIATPTE